MARRRDDWEIDARSHQQSRVRVIMSCPFCTLPQDKILICNLKGVVIRDAYPVSNGHTLIIPRRHVDSLFDLGHDERDALFNLVEEAKRRLEQEFRPDAFNIAINDGPAAGQTVPHLHIHLIPRYENDTPEPRGGVRWIFPERAKYWTE